MHDPQIEEDVLIDNPTIVLWHPALHQQVAHEQLAFLTIGFEPRYQRDIALQVIDRATADVGIRSYTVWELQRKPDVLMKVWIPAGKNASNVWESLRAQARSQPHLGLTLSDSTFLVLTSLAHHLWPRSLTQLDIDDALEVGGDFLASGQVFGPLPDEFSSLIRRGVLAPVAADTVGIKFFIWLSLSELMPSERGRATFERELVRVVTSTPHIYATSIFSGSSTTASYIVSGRFKPEHYEALARELQPRLAALGEPFIATNTDTALSTLFSPIDRSEALLPVTEGPITAEEPRATPLNVSALLEMEESASLEYKGSAFNYIPTTDEGRTDLSSAEFANRSKKVRDAITKGCTGFLNSGGGTLIIGVLEADRVALDVARKYNPSAVVEGGYVVVGVDRTLDGRRLSWDEFERRLRTLLSDSITPSPDPWIDIVRLDHAGMDLAAITIRQPSTWFWAKTSTDSDLFYVRYGNATRPLRGPAQVHHMRSSPRDM